MPHRPAVGRWRLATAVATAVALVAGFGAVVFWSQADRAQRISQVLAAEDARSAPLEGIRGQVVYAQDTAVFITHDLPVPGDDRTYQLWLISDDATVPVGLFRPDPEGSSVAVVEGDVAPGLTLG